MKYRIIKNDNDYYRAQYKPSFWYGWMDCENTVSTYYCHRKPKEYYEEAGALDAVERHKHAAKGLNWKTIKEIT